MEQSKLKKKYGWSEELENFFVHSNQILKTEYKGSFRIKKHNDSYFWYYRLSTNSNNRDKYLCSVEPKEKEPKQSSFEYCCELLLSKLKSNFTISSKDKRYLSPFVQLYIDKIETEGKSKIGRTEKTTKSMMGSLRDFKKWSNDEGIKLQIVPTNDMKIVFKNYIQHLYDRNLSRGSIKGYVEDIRFFLEWLVNDKIFGGLELFPSQPITIQLQKLLIEQICGKKVNSIVEKEFRNEYYENCYNDCIKRIRDIWIQYCENEGVLNRIKDKNGKVNQPPHFLGRDIVYFISLLQLRGGFRIGEVLYAYRNPSVYNEFHLKNYPKDMGSFFDKTEDGWALKIRNSKGKDRNVPINDVIYGWTKPPIGVEFKLVDEGKRLRYETNIVDIIFELFPKSDYYTFPSPNHFDNPNGKRSITHYMNIFKDELSINKQWDKYGVFSSHNLRSFFISYMIRRDDITPYQISEISGNSISVMERYYIRENLQSKLNTFKKITQQTLISNSNKNRRNKD